MYERLLVPLDGSELSERALKPAFGLAERFGSEVILLQVVVPKEMRAALTGTTLRTVDSRRAELHRELEEAKAYLYGLKLHWLAPGLSIQSRVVSGTPSEMIVAAADASGADLIVMCTHGRSGLSRLIYGSVAEAVLRVAHRPMLLVPALVHSPAKVTATGVRLRGAPGRRLKLKPASRPACRGEQA